jgi:hypothetical protein
MARNGYFLLQDPKLHTHRHIMRHTPALALAVVVFVLHIQILILSIVYLLSTNNAEKLQMAQ